MENIDIIIGLIILLVRPQKCKESMNKVIFTVL